MIKWCRVVFPTAMWNDEPIYHGAELWNQDDGFRTSCGRVVGPMRGLLPTKHVRKFGVPCKSCFPGGDTA